MRIVDALERDAETYDGKILLEKVEMKRLCCLARAAERAFLVHTDGCICDLCMTVADVRAPEDAE